MRVRVRRTRCSWPRAPFARWRLGESTINLPAGLRDTASTAGWVVPHFEKMLYDNALLARTALHIGQVSGRELGKRIANETADFLIADLQTTEGGFASALDADTEGVEGRYYVWTPSELVEVLGEDDGRLGGQAARGDS